MAEDEKGKGDEAKAERMNLFVDVKSFVEKRAGNIFFKFKVNFIQIFHSENEMCSSNL